MQTFTQRESPAQSTETGTPQKAAFLETNNEENYA
jgi:hypothetical protein